MQTQTISKDQSLEKAYAILQQVPQNIQMKIIQQLKQSCQEEKKK
jgi:hypothetical protein